MKRCPTCNRSYDDETLSFCLEDGAPLIRDSGSRADSQETLVTPSPAVPPRESSEDLPVTQSYGELPGKATVSVSSFNAPGAHGYSPAKQRRTWPWIVAILVVLFLVIAAVVMAIVIPPMLQASNSNSDNRPQPAPTQSIATITPPPGAAPTERWSVPDDEDEVLSQLTKVEEEWTEANVAGDKEALERILADEYVGANARSKREYIDKLRPDSSIKSWELGELTVDQNGDRATVQGTLTQETAKGTEVYEFTDKFVWRDNRWQAVAARSSRVK